jgi:predicted PurR-regulated permease PerM
MNLQSYLSGILDFLGNAVVPVLLAVAILIFLWNITRYFIIGGANEESQEKARSLAIWGILAFVIIIAVWGIVNIVTETFGISGGSDPIPPDYMREKNENNGNSDIDASEWPSNEWRPIDNPGGELPG